MKVSKALVIAAVMSFALPAYARDLTVVSWGGNYQDAQRKIYFQPFAAKLGATVLDESWDGGYGVLQAKVKAGAPNWDAVQVEAEELELGCTDGIYEKIDWQKLGGKDGFIPAGVSDCGVGAIVLRPHAAAGLSHILFLVISFTLRTPDDIVARISVAPCGNRSLPGIAALTRATGPSYQCEDA